MRYGLPRDEKRKSRWKAAVEDEIKSLKMEVLFLKDQLNRTTKKLDEFTSAKPPDPLAFIQGFSRNKNQFHQFSQNVVNQPSTNEALPPFTMDGNGNNQRFSTGGFQSFQSNSFTPKITERLHYQSTWDYDTTTKKAVRYHSITCMPSYKDDKLFEELRYEDYVLKGIGFSNQIFKTTGTRNPVVKRTGFTNQIQRYKDMQQRSSRAEMNSKGKKGDGNSLDSSFMIPWYITPKLPKAPWPFGPSLKKVETSNSLAVRNVSLDKNIESSSKDIQFTPVFFNFKSTSNNDSDEVMKNESKIQITNKGETLSSQVLQELRLMGEKISLITDKLSKMDSNISDVSSRVSVMDSRLSAVDMFVTMERFDKKWQGLETKLAGLDSPSPAKVRATGTPLHEDISEVAIDPIEKSNKPVNNDKEKDQMEQESFDNKISENKQLTKSEMSTSMALENSSKKEIDSLSGMDTTGANLSDFVRSISCTDITKGSKGLCTSNLSEHNSLSDSLPKSQIASFEMTDIKLNSLFSESSFFTKLDPLESESMITFSEAVPVNDTSKERRNNNEETKSLNLVKSDENTDIFVKPLTVQEPARQINSSKYSSNENIVSDPLGVIEEKCSSSKVDKLFKNEIEKDTENEFVIVEKSDIELSLEDNSKANTTHSSVKDLPNEASSSSDFKIYNDITEYLEVNLGKKKNLVYEFAFEAKPDSFNSDGNSGKENESSQTEENKAESPFKDDSFHQFKTNFIGSKSVDTKQSSPFVFVTKTSEEFTGKNYFENNC